MNQLVALISLFVLSVSGVPQISCTFSADVHMKAKYNDVEYEFQFTHYSVENKVFSQVGQVPHGYPFNSTIIVTPPNRYVIIQPFFERQSCVALSIRSSLMCPEIESDARLEGTDPCPGDRSRLCDKWSFIDAYEVMHYVWLFTGTSTPHQIVYDGEEQGFIETYMFSRWSFDTPDPSHFVIPPSLPCTDMVIDPADDSMMEIRGLSLRRLASTPRGKRLVNDPNEVAKVASLAKAWTAAASTRFDGMTFEQVAKTMLRRPGDRVGLVGTRAAHRTGGSFRPDNALAPIPDEFDSATAWPKCNSEVRDQGSCGSCWAHGASESLGDRFCIHGNASAPLVLSPQWLVSCFKNLFGCDGGYLDIAWEDLMIQGAVSEECCPYKGTNGECPAKCVDGSPLQLFRLKSVYDTFVPFDAKKNMEAIQREIMANGPIEVAFWVFSDFLNYKSGIYRRIKGASFLGGHAVKATGWGFDGATKTPFWKLSNSWGKTFGESGTFRIVRGVNECGIEDEASAGLPKH